MSRCGPFRSGITAVVSAPCTPGGHHPVRLSEQIQALASKLVQEAIATRSALYTCHRPPRGVTKCGVHARGSESLSGVSAAILEGPGGASVSARVQ